MISSGGGAPPAPAPDYPGARRPGSGESGGGERRGRSRTTERPRQGPVRRIRSTGPAGDNDHLLVTARHGQQERKMYTCGGYRDISRQGQWRHSQDPGANNAAMIREMEELRARTQQMEKTLK